MRTNVFSAAILVLACSAEPNEPSSSGSTGGTGPSTGGSGGSSAQGGSGLAPAATGGVPASTGGASPSTGGTSTGGQSPATGGSAVATGGAAGAVASGGSSTGGATITGGASASGGAGAGGVPGTAGSAGSAGNGGSGGAAGNANVAEALDGLRIDDPCKGTPETTDGATCDHATLTNNGFSATEEASLAGSTGTTYAVTLRIRGVVEPTSIEGGMRPDTSTFSYKNGMWRKVPYTIGGTVKTPDYQVWRISVDNPRQDYFLNDYQNTAHNIFELDYEVTIDMAGSAKVTLAAADSNERQIVNYEKYALDGIPGSTNFGQFVQINVVSAVPR